jgi:hypothetical protein
MAHFNLSGRLDFDVCNLPFTDEIRDIIELFESHSLIIWIGKNQPQIDPSHVVEAFMFWFGLVWTTLTFRCLGITQLTS